MNTIIERIRIKARVSEDNFAESDFAAIAQKLDSWFGAHQWDMSELEIAAAKAELLGDLRELCALLCWEKDLIPQ